MISCFENYGPYKRWFVKIPIFEKLFTNIGFGKKNIFKNLKRGTGSGTWPKSGQAYGTLCSECCLM